MKIKCAIVDDEPIARKGLIDYVASIDWLILVGQYESALELSQALTTESIDLIFLDINMPKLSGVEFLRATKVEPKVIFTTAYPEYAIEGFELDVLDYLLKPISFQRFFQAAQKAKSYFELLPQNVKKDYCFVRINKRLEKIFFKDILFLESQQNYVFIHTKEKRLLIHSTLKSFFHSLPKEDFIQTHKSYVIAKAHVQAIEGNQLFIDNHRIPISKYLRQGVLEEMIS